MSLMGGALIVISASDHQSNNLSDEYQQTFYVAETALLEGEKYIINQYLGPYKTNGDRDTSKRQLVGNSTSLFATYVHAADLCIDMLNNDADGNKMVY